MFTEQDIRQMAQQGISPEQAEAQLESIRNGFPYLHIESAASVGDGILALSDDEAQHYVDLWNQYRDQGHRITKFVPASGAASRMFKPLFEFLNSPSNEPADAFVQTFFARIHDFAFFDALDDACILTTGLGADALIEERRFKDVVSALLSDDGLAYGSLPKALLQFHSYDDCVRTPLEEHLAEAALYAASKGQAKVHFTVSPQHRELFQEMLDRVVPQFEDEFHVRYRVTLSSQQPSTDTLAATPEGQPFRLPDGSLLFRPAGHGALLQNLDRLQSDIIFVKNIDNVVPDRLKGPTIRWKQVLGGLLISLQRQTFRHLALLRSGQASPAQTAEAAHFLSDTLGCRHPRLGQFGPDELRHYLTAKLNRPLRVCGMVPNQGEPGGGPFWVSGADGSVTLQILEGSQIDTTDARSRQMLAQSTHFNPVDLVCAVRDSQGQPFPLARYVDPQTGFVSSKSYDGRSLRALELPGLWNGSMSHWNTLMVEVPAETFNPVKTVNDLLRPQHQG